MEGPIGQIGGRSGRMVRLKRSYSQFNAERNELTSVCAESSHFGSYPTSSES